MTFKCVNKDRFWLFSYGTLMLDGMRCRFFGDQITNAYLKGYKIIVDGHLKLVETGVDTDIVTGMILEYDDSEKQAIDKYESKMYEMKPVTAYTCGNINGDSEWECNVYMKRQ
jgi:hypothetical protein